MLQVLTLQANRNSCNLLEPGRWQQRRAHGDRAQRLRCLFDGAFFNQYGHDRGSSSRSPSVMVSSGSSAITDASGGSSIVPPPSTLAPFPFIAPSPASSSGTRRATSTSTSP